MLQLKHSDTLVYQITNFPVTQSKHVDFANALDKTRFGQFIVDYRNGLLTGLGAVDKV
jgi:hypothetical protein